MAFRITVELPDECLKIVNFKSDDEEPPFEFECSDDKSTVLDVKKFINDEEALDLEDPTSIKIYWLFGILQDDVLVKDLLDQKAELYVSLPQFAEITSTDETFVFSKTKGLFGTRKRCLQLFPGCTESFRIPNRGKFAVMRNKIEGRELAFYVRYFEVKDDWNIEINVDPENHHNIKVFQVLEDGNKKELVPGETKEFSMEAGRTQDNGRYFASAGTYFSGICRIIAAIIERCV